MPHTDQASHEAGYGLVRRLDAVPVDIGAMRRLPLSPLPIRWADEDKRVTVSPRLTQGNRSGR